MTARIALGSILLLASHRTAEAGGPIRSDPHHRLVHFEHRVRNSSDRDIDGLDVFVALPASSERQMIRKRILAPEPASVFRDPWGHEVARFRVEHLAAGEECSVHFLAVATLFDVRYPVSADAVGGIDGIPREVRALYLRDRHNYRIESKEIREAAREATKGAAGVLDKVRRIHDHVIERIEYVRDGRWDPAPVVLKRGTGSCSEYTYAMIALLRASGIPARYAGGSACRDPKAARSVDRVFHRWTEVYLPGIGWYPVDASRDRSAAQEKDPHRYFGRLPWSLLVHVRGDGADDGPIGWDYRSRHVWESGPPAGDRRVRAIRSAVWVPVPDPAGYDAVETRLATWLEGGERDPGRIAGAWRPAAAEWAMVHTHREGDPSRRFALTRLALLCGHPGGLAALGNLYWQAAPALLRKEIEGSVRAAVDRGEVAAEAAAALLHSYEAWTSWVAKALQRPTKRPSPPAERPSPRGGEIEGNPPSGKRAPAGEE